MAKKILFYVYEDDLWGGYFNEDPNEVTMDRRLLFEEIVGVKIERVERMGEAIVFTGEKE
jgi:hypothetical protein